MSATASQPLQQLADVPSDVQQVTLCWMWWNIQSQPSIQAYINALLPFFRHVSCHLFGKVAADEEKQAWS